MGKKDITCHHSTRVAQCPGSELSLLPLSWIWSFGINTHLLVLCYSFLFLPYQREKLAWIFRTLLLSTKSHNHNKNIITRNFKGINTNNLPQLNYHPHPRPHLSKTNIKIKRTMSDASSSPVSSQPEGMDRGFTPVNPAPKINITPEQPTVSSKSKTKEESSVQVAQPGKMKSKGVEKDMHTTKTKKESTGKTIQPDKVKAKAKDTTQASSSVELKSEKKSKLSLKPKMKSNPFIMTEAKAASKPKPKPKMKSPSPESGNNSGSEDPAPADEKDVELQMKDITNRNKTTVAKLVQALSTRGLPTSGNRADVTGRFILYELGLDTTGSDKQMHAYCKELLQASMTGLKETLAELKQNCVGTNKPELVGRILKATYEDDEESDDGEEESSSEAEDKANEQASKSLATPSTSPDSVANGKKRARAVEEDSGEHDATPKRRKVVTFEDEIEEPSSSQRKVKKSSTNGDKMKKRQRSEESDRGSPEGQQSKKVKLTESKPKPQDKNRVSAAEIGREVRAKPNPSTIKPKSKKSKKDDNHFTFNDVLDSRIIFENAQVPANVLSCALKVLTGLGTIKDVNCVHDFRHDHGLPLFKLYREGKYKPNTKQCPKEYLAAQEFYQEREEELVLTIREAEIKEDEENAEQMAREQGKMMEDEEEETEDEDELGFEDDEQPHQGMSDEDNAIDDLMTAFALEESSATDSNGENLAKIYQHAQIAAYYEGLQKDLDDADELRGKSLHASEISYLASIPQGTTIGMYYNNLWEPESDEECTQEEKMEMRKEEISYMKMTKVQVGSEEFRKIRLSHDGKW